MLKSATERKLSSKFLLLEDTEDVCGGDLFAALLANFSRCEPTKKIHLICLEYPPDFYLPGYEKEDNVIVNNFFTDPCGWNEESTPDLNSFISNLDEYSDRILFVDSLYYIVARLGFFKTYNVLHKLKWKTECLVCFAHSDLFTLTELEKLEFLSNLCIKLKSNSENYHGKKNNKVADVTYKKPNGKVSVQTEVFSISDEFEVFSQVSDDKQSNSKGSSNVKTDFDNLTTFELGLQMKDTEKKAKEQLVLPYLRSEEKSGAGDIIYNLEAVDLEDDPDDDLDI